MLLYQKIMIGIYKITNIITGDMYVGQSRNIKHRFHQHRSPKNIATSNILVAIAMRKFGVSNFKFGVIEECTIEMLDQKEMYWISKLHPSYNKNEGGKGNRGHKVSGKTKEKLAKAAKKQWNSYPDETKRYILDNNLIGPRKGHEVSLGTREKLRNANLGKKAKEETRRKMSESNKKAVHWWRAYKKVYAFNDAKDKFLFFDSVKEASEYFNGACISAALKGRKMHCRGYNWRYRSVETIGDECNQVGTSLSRVEVQGIRKDEEIAHSHQMINDGDSDRGLVELARRSGKIKMVYAEVVRESDEFSVEFGLNPNLEHKPQFDSSKPMTHVYAVCHFNDGGYNFVVLSKSDVERLRMRSPMQKGTPSGAWHTDYEAMAKAKALKQLAKYLPLNIDQMSAISSDEAIIQPECFNSDGSFKIEDATYDLMPNEANTTQEDGVNVSQKEPVDAAQPTIFPEDKKKQ